MTQAGLKWRITLFSTLVSMVSKVLETSRILLKVWRPQALPGRSWVMLEKFPKKKLTVMLSPHSFLMSTDQLFQTILFLFLINVAFQWQKPSTSASFWCVLVFNLFFFNNCRTLPWDIVFQLLSLLLNCALKKLMGNGNHFLNQCILFLNSASRAAPLWCTLHGLTLVHSWPASTCPSEQEPPLQFPLQTHSV